MVASPCSFVARNTHLRPVPGLEEIRLHLADEVLPLWHAVQIETGDPDAALPYWAFAWAGGLAIGRYLREHPEAVVGRRVFDVASGSGLCAIASMHAGAAEATGADIDPFAAAAMERNARANGRRVTVVRRDVLDEEPPDVDVILAGDCWYEARLAGRVLLWLHRARDRGIDVLIGDLGRPYLPTDELVELASYDVRTTTELEDLERKQGRVYSLRPVRAHASDVERSRATLPARKETGMGVPTSVEAYLAALPEESRAALEKLRQTIRAAAPEATETISYQMPAFRANGRMLLYYAAFKDHCSLFPMSMQIIETHRADLEGYSTSKGTIRFHPDKPLPDALVEKIVKARIAENAPRSRR